VAGYVPFNAVASHTYQLGLGTPANNQSASVRPVTLGIYPQPPNDRFTNAISIAGESMIVPFYTVAATHDSGEPNHAGASGSASVWFNWLAPADGISLLQLSNVNFSAALGVYTGNVVSGLKTITNSSQPTSPVTTPVRAGVTYHIAIDGVGASVGEGLLSLQFFPTPLNDFFVDRTAITGDFATLRGDNHLATRESGEPALGGLGRPPFVPQATLWWEWTAPRTGPVRLTSRDSATKLAGVIWVGTQLTNLYALTTLQLTNGESLPVPLQVQAGNKYVISIGTFGEDRGEIGLEIAYPPPPANDNFASRQFLTGSSVRVSGTVAGASTEPGDPSAAPSVWFAWTAPRHGRAVVTVNTDISVYRGTNLSNLTLLVSGNSGKAAFRAGPGEEYQLAVSSPYLQDFVLNLDLLDSPPNDDFAQRATITGSSIVRPVSMLGSTSENEGYIASDDDGDLWWVWTPPWSGPATISCPGSSSIDVYVGDTSRFAQTFTSNDGGVSFQSFYGRLHLIRVAGNQQLLTTLTLALAAPSAIQRVVQADQTTGTFDLNLSGLPRQVIAINASEDLINWESLGLYTFLDTNLRITDSLARSRRFYQIVPLK